MKFFAVFLLAFVALFNAYASPPPKPLREGLRIYVEQVRELFPDIRFYDVSGVQSRLSQSKGALLLVNFWATWCAPCVEELPQLQMLQERYAGKLRVIAINEDTKGFEVITPFVKQHALEGLAHFHDKDQIEYTKLQMKGLPMSFLIDEKGNLIATIMGKIDWLGSDMEGLLRKTYLMSL